MTRRSWRTLQVEAVDAEHAVDGDVAPRAALDRREGVDAAQARLDPYEVLLRDEVGLIEEQPVGERRLRHRLVDDAVGLLLVEVALDVLGIDEGDDAVEARKAADHRVDQERLRHRRRVRHPRRLDHDPVECNLACALARCELVEDLDEIGSYGAADAAVEDLDDLLVGLELTVLCDEPLVDADFAEFVLKRG